MSPRVDDQLGRLIGIDLIEPHQHDRMTVVVRRREEHRRRRWPATPPCHRGRPPRSRAPPGPRGSRRTSAAASATTVDRRMRVAPRHPGSDAAIRRTSSWVITARPPSDPGEDRGQGRFEQRREELGHRRREVRLVPEHQQVADDGRACRRRTEPVGGVDERGAVCLAATYSPLIRSNRTASPRLVAHADASPVLPDRQAGGSTSALGCRR